jgi:hypothetical protein
MMNVTFPHLPSDAPAELASSLDTAIAAIEAALMDYVAVREAGPMPWFANERRPQAMWGLQHVAALDPARGASVISIHHKVWNEQKKDFVFPGSAHDRIDTAVNDAFYWANKGYDVYWSMGGQAKAGEHYPNRPYPSALRRGHNVALLRCLYIDIDVKPEPPKKGEAPKGYASRGRRRKHCSPSCGRSGLRRQ